MPLMHSLAIVGLPTHTRKTGKARDPGALDRGPSGRVCPDQSARFEMRLRGRRVLRIAVVRRRQAL